jgi:glycosyltransferase involved in cell wall biosynthesis
MNDRKRPLAADRPPVVAVDARPLAVIGNGVSRLVSELVRALGRRDDVRLLLLSNRAPHTAHDLSGLELHVDQRWAGRPGTLWLMMRMNAMARHHGAHMVWGTGHVLPPRARELGRVVSIHDLVHLVMPESMRSMHLHLSRMTVDRSIRTADAVVALSRTTARDIERLLQVDPARITTILPGSGLDELAPATDMPALPQRYLFALGSLEPRKNIDGLLGAFEWLTNTHPDLHLVLTGLHSWKAERIMAVLERPALKSRVVLTGYLSDAQVMACMRGAEAFVMSSHYEGFGLPILEAAGKTRIVLSDTPIFREVAGYLRNASLVDFHDPAAAATAIGRALDGDASFTELAPNCRHELRWDTAAARHAQVFRQVLERREP